MRKNKSTIIVSSFFGTFLLFACIFSLLLFSVANDIENNLNSFELPEVDIPISLPITNRVEGVFGEEALVIDVVDGDTIKVLTQEGERTIRLIGIDTPELRPLECKGLEAKEFLSNLVLDQEVTLESDPTQGDTDRYQRDLRYIWEKGVNINKELIESGLAKEYTYNKPYKYTKEFKQSEITAQNKEIGIWSKECK